MTETTAGWAKTYSLGLWVLDSLVVAVATLVGLGVSGLGLSSLLSGSAEVESQAVSYVWVTVGLVIAWALFLEIAGARNSQVFARGLREYQRVFNATVLLFIVLAALSFLFRAEPSRLFIGVTLALGFLGLLIARTLARRFIWLMRKRGRMLTTVFLVGSDADIAAVGGTLGQSFESGYRIVGSLTIMSTSIDSAEAVEKVSSDLREKAWEADLVIVANAGLFAPQVLDEFAARLDVIPLALSVVATPDGVAVARMRWEVEAQSNLLRVRDVQLSSLARLGKRLVDLIFALAAIIVLLPLFIATAIFIKVDSRGPVFFRQIRVGQFGREFAIMKFRSMQQGAEKELERLSNEKQDAGNSILFKLKNDPRVTRVGKFLRRWSIDELPQLFNVVKGEMSLVGPRPPLPLEVEEYEGSAYRRLAAKPGLTGLWQVSGRSDLSWEESVKIDLDYVENWSPLIDVLIVVKTLPAVLRKKGAY